MPILGEIEDIISLKGTVLHEVTENTAKTTVDMLFVENSNVMVFNRPYHSCISKFGKMGFDDKFTV